MCLFFGGSLWIAATASSLQAAHVKYDVVDMNLVNFYTIEWYLFVL